MPRWTVAIVSAFIAAVLSAGVVGVLTVGSGDDRVAAADPITTTTTTSTEGGSSTTGGPTTTTTAGAAGSIEAVVPTLQAFVEKERGLKFKSPVDVTLLPDEEFEKRVTETDEEDREEIEHAEAVLRAMGLLDDDVDLAAVVRSFTAGAVLGFYDTDTKELVVRGARPTPFVRAVLVHELLHALEDQNFNLDREDLGDEAFLGFQALAEGSAVRIEERYRESLSEADERAAAREERSFGGNVPDVAEVVQVLFGFPYAFGPALVDAIVDAGGQARLDTAYATDPPASTEHVLEPESYLKGDDPKPVPTPSADGKAFDDGEIGQLFLALMLRNEIDADDAREAADGWGGDHYVAWKDGDRTCVRMDFVMDTPADTAQLTAALADWADERKSTATATATSLRTCG